MDKNKNKKSNNRKTDLKDNIEYADSFEEARAIIKDRLIHLRVDLANHTPAEDHLLAEICSAREDQKKALMDLYAAYYSPCSVSDTQYIPKGQGDMNDVMIDFSEGFTQFIDTMEEQYVDMILRRRRAVILLSKMLSFKFPYSRILYLYYYKAEDPAKITEQLFISRATFYRMKSSAINALTKMYYPPKDADSETVI